MYKEAMARASLLLLPSTGSALLDDHGSNDILESKNG
jgi:hypothetical protein